MKRDAAPTRAPESVPLPRISRWLFRWFAKYAERYLRRHVHAVRVSRSGPPPALGDRSAVLYLNHPSWWDPLVGLFLATRFWPERAHYAAIDAAALQRYRFFERIGFFGIEPGSVRGARRLLSIGQGVLAADHAMLWITAQGEFADCRARPLELRRGLSHVAARAARGLIVPLAIEYTFWQERFPEVLVRFGEPIDLEAESAVGRLARDAEQWQALLAVRLEATQDALAREAIARRAADFTTLLSGRAGVGGVYQHWLKVRSRWRGETFRPEHGDEDASREP
ncbi:MAG: lysophospholipid acyltransferase family protein [Pirellulales bacterium]